jgi:hypothetical protein
MTLNLDVRVTGSGNYTLSVGDSTRRTELVGMLISPCERSACCSGAEPVRPFRWKWISTVQTEPKPDSTSRLIEKEVDNLVR